MKKYILWIVLMMFSAVCYGAPTIIKMSIDVSTPTAVYHATNCTINRFDLDPQHVNNSWLLATSCSAVSTTSALSGTLTLVPLRLFMAQVNGVPINGPECVYIDHTINSLSGNTLVIECGWEYPTTAPDIMRSGFEHN